MKKGLLFGIFMIMSVVLLAQENASAYDAGSAVAQHETHVTPAQALNVGYTFMRTGAGANTGTRGGTHGNEVPSQAMQLVYTGQAYDSLTSTITDCYYVFALQPKGFVIVAADDRVEPILGYSYDNNFVVENMPDHVRGWLGNYEKQIQAVVKNNLQAEPASQAKWSRLKSGQSTGSRSGGSVGPLLTTTWDQGQYYNNLCPADANGPAGHVYTGCVATAMAQIIHYWGYPVHGRGDHSYYGNYGELTVNYANANYDHSLMPDALTSTSTTQEVDAVATLMRDCGVAVNMGYSPTESSSFDQDARTALINFYRFSPNLSFAEKAYFSDSEWNAMLHADLDNNRPVYYSGQGSGGHAFVCDGYNANGYYHFNFGWGGFADGWFLTSSITPGGSNFNDSQAAIFGIVPDSTGNVILGQTKGTSTFTVDEPLEFYHLMGHNAYEGGNYDNGCNNTIHFIPANSTNQIVADILDYEDQTLNFSDGDGNSLRSLVGGSDNDYSPVVSNHNALNIAYSGNMYYAGFKVSISQTDNNGCRMVSNITSFVEATTVHLTWTENGTATQWEIEYGIKGFALGTGTVYTADTNTATFSNLSKFTEYDFYIRPVCGIGLYGQRNKVTVMVEAEYWQDIVTSQPAGYVYNAQTHSVEISTAEGLAWWAKNVSFSYANPKVYLTADINLSGYKWRPAEIFYHGFDGQGHQITNAYIQESTGNVGLFSMITDGNIENFGLTNSYIKGCCGHVGGICGYYLTSGGYHITVRNCYVSNCTIDGTNASVVGGFIGLNQGADVINCYANVNEIGGKWQGLMIGESSQSAKVKNCYAAGTMRILTYCNEGGVVAVVSNSEVSNCYSVRIRGGVVVNHEGAIADTSTFIKSGDCCTLLTPIDFDGFVETDLLSALNRGLELCNDSLCCIWIADTGNVNGGYPILGSNHYIIQCQTVSDVSVQNIAVNNIYAVMVSWAENGNASQWRIRFRLHDRPDTAYTYITTMQNPDTIYGIPLGNMYDFNVRAICDTVNRSAWSKTLSLIVDLPFWTDIVTTKPAGYVEDADGNVEIYSTEGLAWLAVITNGFHNQQQSSFEGKTVTLKSDVNIDGYRWYPIGGFSGIFNGENHSVSNIYMNKASGLFGYLTGSLKNIKLIGGLILGGSGGLIGSAYNCHEISNCHTSTTVNGGGGSLCGEIWNTLSSKTIISNCSSSGTVTGDNSCGSLIGYVHCQTEEEGEIEIRNCYATGDVKGSRFIGGLIGFLRGAKIYNCFSTGHVEFNPDYRIGNVIGCQDLGTVIQYLYGQDSVNVGLDLIGCWGNFPNTYLFHHEGNTNTLLSSVSINDETPNNLSDALNAWVALQNDPTLRTWILDTLTGYPVFGNYYIPSCNNPTNLNVSQATAVGNENIKTRLEWTQKGNPNHWEVLYVANGQNIDSGTVIPANNTSCVLTGIPVGQALDFYVRAVCGDGDTSYWCGPVTYIPDKLHWTEVVTSQPEGYYEDANGNVYISSAEGLSWLSSITNELNGAQYNKFYGKQIFLTKDIDLSSYRWTAIGRLYGSFNGNNHVISGLYCNEFSGYQGLFGYMQGDITNVVLAQCKVHGTRTTTGNGTSGSIGGIVGYAVNNSIANCMVTGNVRGGGIVGSHICYYWTTCSIENSCFIGNDDIDGYPVGICESSMDVGIVNCYVVNPNATATSNRYYIGETNNSDFSGSDNTWTLNTPPYINGTFHTDLLDALNTWVDINNTDGQYRHWVTDTAMVNGGYPIFEAVSFPPVTSQDTVVVSGYYSWNGMVFISDTVMSDTIPTLNGYDSVVTHHIIVTPTPLTEISVNTCSNYTWNGKIYTETGDYIQIFTAENGSDSVVVLRLSINPLTGVDEQIACDSYLWIDGVTYVASNHSATYTLQTADGCDSVVTLHLTIGHSNTGDTTAVACNSFNWHEYANLTQSGDYTRTVTNAAGCDSVVTLHLTVNYSNSGDTTAVACDSFDWYEQTNLTQSGDYTRTVTNASGCDSVVTLHLTVNYSNTGDTTAVACDSFDWYEQTNLSQSGDYTRTITNAAGCDSVVTLHLTVNYSNFGDTTAVICDSFDWYEQTDLTQSGDYTRTFTNVSGCDSVVTLHLTVNYSNSGDTTAVACDSFEWYEQTDLTQSGDYTRTLTNASGCDSVVTLHLTVNYSNSGDTTAVACDSFDWYEQTDLTQSGDYTRTLTNASGCDSVVTLHLTVNYSNSGDTTAVVCDSFDWHEYSNLTQSGDYTRTLTNADGCDSVVTLHLSVNYSNSGDTTSVACDSFDWHEYSNLTQSGDYTRTFTNVSGCDSVVTLHLTVNYSNSGDTIAVACDSFDWYEQTDLTQSGDYTRTITNANGCDSVVTLHLTVNYSNSGDTTAVACDSFDWHEQTNLTQSGDYIRTFTNASGCDSVVTLHLTVNYVTHNVETETACESFTWHGATYATSGTYTYEYTNATGCASVDTLYLTVNHGTHNVETETACESFTWHGATYATSGTYTYEYNNAAGCASVDTLHLTVNYGIHNVETETACENFTWHGATYTTSGTYTYEYTNANGCVSVDTLHLTVNHGTHYVESETACESFTWHGTEYTASGTYTYEYTNASGCASVDTLHLTINFAQSAQFAVTTADSCYIWNAETYCESGDYTQTLTAANGCDSTVTLHLTITVGIDDHNDFAFNLFPNPTNGVVNVQCTMNNVQVGTMEFHVFDAYGNLVDVVKTRCTTSLQTAQIDLSGFAAGVYFVKAVADGNVVAVKKVVKQ